MFDRGMTISFYSINCPPIVSGIVNKNRTYYGPRFSPSMAIQISSVLLQSDEGGTLPESKKISTSSTAFARRRISNPLLSQANTVGIIGGVSVFSTLIFLEKLVWRSSRGGNECVPFVVCSDPEMSREFPFCSSYLPVNGNHSQFVSNSGLVVENLRHKREFLEKSGAGCIVMPCHISHAWLVDVSEGCSVPFLDMGDCVARELKEAKMKPLVAGCDVRIGVLASDATSVAGFYQEKLQSQGFEVVLPDKATMEHTVVPAIEALNRKDMEGARNLLRIAIQVLLVRAVNCVVLASDEFHSLLPRHDPLHKKCIDPIDALARFTIKWSQSTEKVHKQTSKKLN